MRPENETDLAAVEQALAGLDIRDRLVSLVMSVAKHNGNNVLGPAFALVSVVKRLTEGMNPPQKFRTADVLRNTADEIETLEETTIN